MSLNATSYKGNIGSYRRTIGTAAVALALALGSVPALHVNEILAAQCKQLDTELLVVEGQDALQRNEIHGIEKLAEAYRREADCEFARTAFGKGLNRHFRRIILQAYSKRDYNRVLAALNAYVTADPEFKHHPEYKDDDDFGREAVIERAFGMSYNRLGDDKKPLPILLRAKGLYEENFPEPYSEKFIGILNRELAIAYINRMRQLWRDRDYNGLADFIKDDKDINQYILEAVRKQFLGRAYLRLGNNEEAIRLFKEALSLSAQVPEGHSERFITKSKKFLNQAKH